MTQIITMYHGGRDLEYSYSDFVPAKKNRWEFGPGLYVTSHFDRARSYAKGGGKVYKVEFELGKPIEVVKIPFDDVNGFIMSNVVGKLREQVLEDIHGNMKRMNLTSHVEADVFLNLMINYDAVIGKKTVDLAKFLVEQGVDYLADHRFGGRDETICAIFNRKAIKRVKSVKPSDVPVSDYELNVKDIILQHESVFKDQPTQNKVKNTI